MSSDKRTARERFKSSRMRLSAEEATAKSALVKKLLFDLPEFRDAKTVAFYVAKRASREVETEGMIREGLAMGKRVLVPFVDKMAGKILFSELRDYDSELTPGTFNILEPKVSCRRVVPPQDSDMILVPGVAFDVRGHRLGYGGAYYDRLLRRLASAKPSPPFVGLAYETQVAEKLPTTPHDVPVDILVTEKRVLRFKP